MTLFCTHYECRLDAISDLMALANVTLDLHKKSTLLAAATKANSGGEVRCRKTPRPGPVRAPFPGE